MLQVNEVGLPKTSALHGVESHALRVARPDGTSRSLTNE